MRLIVKKLKSLVSLLFFLFLLPSAAFAGTKNVILMINDGQGIGNIMAADFYSGKRAVYESFEVKYLVTTYADKGGYDPDEIWKSFDSFSYDPTDSAAAATAMASGYKTSSGLIGKKPDMSDVENIVEIAEKRGKSTGVVTSVQMSHATPAGMVAHSESRKSLEEIAKYMILESGLDVIMGAGHPLFDDNASKKSFIKEYESVGGKDIFKNMTGTPGLKSKDCQIWKFIDSRDDFEKAASGGLKSPKLLGLARVGTTLNQARSGDPQVVNLAGRNAGVPSLAVMSRAAINSLSEDKDGFFLMIEGGAVDWANHSNQKGRAIEEQLDFNDAVSAVVEWVDNKSSWNETLLIVTADHETGCLWGDEKEIFVPVMDKGKGQIPEMVYHSKKHTNALVPLYAKGEAATLFSGMKRGRDSFMAKIMSSHDKDFSGDYIDNTDIFRVMKRAISDGQLTGAKSN